MEAATVRLARMMGFLIQGESMYLARNSMKLLTAYRCTSDLKDLNFFASMMSFFTVSKVETLSSISSLSTVGSKWLRLSSDALCGISDALCGISDACGISCA